MRWEDELNLKYAEGLEQGRALEQENMAAERRRADAAEQERDAAEQERDAAAQQLLKYIEKYGKMED